MADDEGWRLEIPGIPELTSFGAHRGHDLDEAGMLHVGLGDGNDLAPGDHITGKPATRTAANGGVAPAFLNCGTLYQTVDLFAPLKKRP